MINHHHHHHVHNLLDSIADDDVRKRRSFFPRGHHLQHPGYMAAGAGSDAGADHDCNDDGCEGRSAPVVDFSLASTYVPGILCLLRTAFVIVLMSREWATHSIPTLIILGIFLYVDRIVRQEVIFDSSALTCTIFVTHVLNICRSKIAHVDPLVAVAISASSNSSSSAGAIAQQQQQLLLQLQHPAPGLVPTAPVSWFWQQQLVFAAYCGISTLLLVNVDVSTIAVLPASTSFPFSSRQQCLLPDYSIFPCNGNNNGLRVSTIVLHCLFVGTVLQIAVTKDEFMLPWKIMLRSFLFLFLSLCWTYAVGIHDACMQIRTYPYFYNPVLQGKFVQPFTPCQLRFLVILFLDSWFLLGTGAIMLCIVCRNLSTLVAQLAGSAGGAASSAAPHHPPSATPSGGEKQPSPFPPLPPLQSKHRCGGGGAFAMQDPDIESQQGFLPAANHQHGNSLLYQTISSSSMCSGAVTPPNNVFVPTATSFLENHHFHHQQQQLQQQQLQISSHAAARQQENAERHENEEDDMAAMFRLARKAQAVRLGEQI